MQCLARDFELSLLVAPHLPMHVNINVNVDFMCMYSMLCFAIERSECCNVSSPPLRVKTTIQVFS